VEGVEEIFEELFARSFIPRASDKQDDQNHKENQIGGEMTLIAQFIRLAVSIFEWCEFTMGSIIVIALVDWGKIERDRQAWEER